MSYASTISIEALEADPFPIHARLRREEPLVEVAAANASDEGLAQVTPTPLRQNAP